MFLFFHYDLIVPNKYGFRPGSNTSDCLVALIEEITTIIGQGEFAITLQSFFLNWPIMVSKTWNTFGLNPLFNVEGKESMVFFF